jgi:Endonuclease-reverse transcriptase
MRIDSPNVTGIQIQGEFGTLRIMNIYNNCKNNESLHMVERTLRNPSSRAYLVVLLRQVWLGNFNCHHPLWDEERNNHLFTNTNLEKAQMLLNMLARHGMKMALPKDTPTLEAMRMKNYTRVDNVFCSEELLKAFVMCDTMPEKRPNKTDHMPVIIVIDIRPPQAGNKPQMNFRMTDWAKFARTLAEKLEVLLAPHKLTTTDEFKRALENLDTAIHATMAQHVPISRPCPHSK